MVLCDRIHLFIMHKNNKLIMCWNAVNEAESCIAVTDAALLALLGWLSLNQIFFTTNAFQTDTREDIEIMVRECAGML